MSRPKSVQIDMPVQAVRAYYFIESYVHEHGGQFPSYLQIGRMILPLNQNTNTLRNTGVRHVNHLRRQGFVIGSHRQRVLTGKRMRELFEEAE